MDWLTFGKWFLRVAIIAALGFGMAYLTHGFISTVTEPAARLDDVVNISDDYASFNGENWNTSWSRLLEITMFGCDATWVRPYTYIRNFLMAMIAIMIAGFLFNFVKALTSE